MMPGVQPGTMIDVSKDEVNAFLVCRLVKQ